MNPEKNRESAPTKQETLIYNKTQIGLATRFFPEVSPGEAMLMWAGDDNNSSKDFREVLEEDSDLKKRLLAGDSTAIDEIEEKIKKLNAQE